MKCAGWGRRGKKKMVLLHGDPGTRAENPYGTDQWTINGQAFRNSASRFWSALLDEIAHEFPACDAAVMTAPGEGMLSVEDLNPQAQLEKALGETSALRQLELYGAPRPVSIQLRHDDIILAERELPRSCLDAELLSYLLAWLLKWGEVPECQWNSPSIESEFTAADAQQSTCCHIRFHLQNRHVSEGLFERQLRLEVRP
jgi:hypothetical protein